MLTLLEREIHGDSICEQSRNIRKRTSRGSNRKNPIWDKRKPSSRNEVIPSCPKWDTGIGQRMRITKPNSFQGVQIVLKTGCRPADRRRLIRANCRYSFLLLSHVANDRLYFLS